MQSSDEQRVEGVGTSGSDGDGQLEAPVISVTVKDIGQNKISNNKYLVVKNQAKTVTS